MKIKWTLLYVALGFAFSVTAQPKPDDIVGIWYNEEKTAKINVYKQANTYQGEIIWVDLQPGDSGFDENNPDPVLTKRPLVGLVLLENFEYEDGEYVNGEIYDPNNGKTYSCYMKMEEKNKLFVRGYIGFSLIGRTTYWTRVEGR